MTLEDFLLDTVIEMIKEGEAKGKVEGEAKGNFDGRCNAKLDSIIRLLKKKFKNEINKEIMTRLESLPIDKFEQIEEIIIDRIFNLNSLEEVEEILSSIS